ncbi:MAG TPA: hypothetical protein ENG30_03505 [Thermofilaceae archaeon]|nr:hypothetical protein [Thermofilaceae archaeon]
MKGKQESAPSTIDARYNTPLPIPPKTGDMFSELVKYSKRLELAALLRARGLYVRWHAYEYLLGLDGRIVGVLLLEPTKRVAWLYMARHVPRTAQEEVAKTVSSIIKELDPDMRIKVLRLSLE